LKAFVLVQTQAGREPVGVALRAIPGVESANDLTVAYDAIALANAESVGDLFETVLPREEAAVRAPEDPAPQR
jgi:hypothetical protein